MKILKKAVIFALAAAPALTSLTSCQDMFEPAIENFKDQEDLEKLPQWATGLLGHAYISNPLGSWRFDDVATDDAVSNDVNNGYRKMADGAWTAQNNPQDQWQYLRASWQYLNQFIELVDKVKWAKDEVVAELFKMRFKGDAYGMRALYMYHLLRHHAGVAGGEYLGIPILLESETLTSNFNLPRNTFKECIEQIYADVEMAISLLPEEYGDISNNSQIPSKYASTGCDFAQYTRVFGNTGKNRMSARIAKAVRAQAALMAASPAYAGADAATWEDAAEYMATVLKEGLGSNPIANMDPDGGQWYVNAETIKNMEAGYNSPEMLWRANKEESSSLEKDNYPPTLFGNGRINPTQNLVDAFPMANGLPITASGSGYDATNPYANRDPRLSMYILYNGATAGNQNTVITTVGGGDNNSMGMQIGKSTETGYYMKKLLCQQVNADPNNTTNLHHIKPFIRYTEIFLGFAEAANEAWGPKGGSQGFTAYQVIKALRERAGICVGETDAYLDVCAGSKDMMRELIRNERRLELCFEGFRFWDLRRWNADLNESIEGVTLSVEGEYGSAALPTHGRDFKDYMNYGPIPYSEVLKYSNLKQNDGWESGK